MTYQEQIKSPKWQKKRLEILNLRGFKCEKCSCEERQLHIHHRFYLKDRKAWEYNNDVFQVLYHSCHENEHLSEHVNDFDIYKYLILRLNDKDEAFGVALIIDSLIDIIKLKKIKGEHPCDMLSIYQLLHTLRLGDDSDISAINKLTSNSVNKFHK